MIPYYRVWDELNAEEDSARTIAADDARAAAIEYAKRDRDGMCDGLYTSNGEALRALRDGQPISVRAADGVLMRFLVGVCEFTPVFAAVAAEP